MDVLCTVFNVLPYIEIEQGSEEQRQEIPKRTAGVEVETCREHEQVGKSGAS